MSRDFWREKKQSLSPNKHNQGDTSQHRTIQEESHQRESNQENEDDTSQDENNGTLTKELLPIRSDNKMQDTTKITAQELWKIAFSNLEQQNFDLMKKFKELMILELNGMGHSNSIDLNAQDDWDMMELFISRQATIISNPKLIKLHNGLDEAFRILRGIIEMINEPIKLIP